MAIKSVVDPNPVAGCCEAPAGKRAQRQNHDKRGQQREKES
jgi:hypothetical protein